MGFFLYKGLKKPLVFFGLKDKYIYYAGAIVIGGFIFIAVLNSLMGFLGTVIGSAIIGIGVWGTFYLQDKKGIYNKTRNKNEVHIYPKQFKNKVMLKYQNEEK